MPRTNGVMSGDHAALNDGLTELSLESGLTAQRRVETLLFYHCLSDLPQAARRQHMGTPLQLRRCKP